MERQGFWDLFWATGLPEAWLVAHTDPGEKREEEETLCPPPYPPPREL